LESLPVPHLLNKYIVSINGIYLLLLASSITTLYIWRKYDSWKHTGSIGFLVLLPGSITNVIFISRIRILSEHMYERQHLKPSYLNTFCLQPNEHGVHENVWAQRDSKSVQCKVLKFCVVFDTYEYEILFWYNFYGNGNYQLVNV
jgi:hypothetical protein